MADEPGLWSSAFIIGGALASMLAGLVTGRKSAKREPETDAQVLAASLVPHTEMRDLTRALGEVRHAVEHSVEITEKLVGLLESDRHERELAKAVRDALEGRKG